MDVDGISNARRTALLQCWPWSRTPAPKGQREERHPVARNSCDVTVAEALLDSPSREQDDESCCVGHGKVVMKGGKR